jgi:hypothetical protein
MTDTIEPVRRRDEIIDAIWHCLPASSIKEITRKVSHHMGKKISRGMVSMALVWLRSHPDTYHWTVSHVKRGRLKPGETDRFFAILCDGTDTLFDEVHRKHIEAGSRSTVRETVRKSANQAKALLAASKTAPTLPLRRRLAELAADYGTLQKKAAAVMREMDLANGA